VAGGRIIVTSGKASIVLDDGAARMAERLLRRAAPEVLAALEREADAIVAEARPQWPVKTGKSKDALDWALRLRSLEIVETVVFDPVPYVYFIKGKKQGGKSTWNELVVKPGRRRAKKLAEEIGSRLKRVAVGG
jgi:hypothetical protein